MNRLLQILSGRRIAIVGNAYEELDRSAEIDSADVVVRFNHFYNYDSNKVGKRVDVVLQTIAKAWFDAYNADPWSIHLDVIKQQRPAIFLVKRPDNYHSDAHAVYGGDVRIDNTASMFEPWWKYTSGTAALCYLAANLTNAEVKVYGFSQGNDRSWGRYIETDAKHYAQVADEERMAQREAIAKLESLKITEPGDGSIPRCVVVPVKAVSSGCPGKNRALLRGCLEKLSGVKMPIFVTGDDYDLLHDVQNLAETVPLPMIPCYDDVTNTLRKWKVSTGFCGDVALVQCTSPGLKAEWVDQCFEALSRAPVSATAVVPDFKPTALFREENGVFVPCSQALPPASVARQLLPRTVRITGAVVAFHTDALVGESLWSYGTLAPVIVDEADSLDVDTPEQLAKALGKEKVSL